MSNWRYFLHVSAFVLFALMLFFPVAPGAAEIEDKDAATEEVENEGGQNGASPQFGPEGSYYFGYRWVSQEDSLKAAEYQYPHSSVTFGVDVLAAPLPHRYHLNAEFLNKKDYYGDVGYAYGDLILFRDIFVGVRHNLNHFNYQYPPVPPSIRYNDRNRNDGYFVDYFNNALSLRLKTPDFPFHAFFQNRYVARDGSVEERFVLGDFTNLVKVSETRDINWHSNETTIGANTHLGPVEIEYSYDFSRFDPGRDNVLYDSFPQSVIFGRPADTYPHNVIPETEATANHLMLHTSYTGQVVASASLSNQNQKNNYSQAESTTWRGAFDLRWLPDPVIGLFFKYRHKDMDADNPEYVSLTGLAHTNVYEVRKSISYEKDVFSLSGRYRPLNRLTFLAAYEFEHLDRKDVDEWKTVPDKSNVHHINLKATGRPFTSLKLKAVYDYKYNDNPSYNIDPDSSNQLRLAATFTPIPWLSLYADYTLSITEREQLRYINPVPAYVIEGGERDGRTDHFLASCSFLFTEKSTMTAGWAYSRWKVEQDLLYAKIPGAPALDAGVPYVDTANTFSLAFQYLPREDITVSADISYTIAEGEYIPLSSMDAAFGSTAELSNPETSETIFTLGLNKRFSNDWELGLKVYADLYDDRSVDQEDGQLYATTFLIKRYF